LLLACLIAAPLVSGCSYVPVLVSVISVAGSSGGGGGGGGTGDVTAPAVVVSNPPRPPVKQGPGIPSRGSTVVPTLEARQEVLIAIREDLINQALYTSWLAVIGRRASTRTCSNRWE
jgi:hypothetical protein